MNKIKESEDTLIYSLLNSLNRENDPKIVTAKKDIEDIAYIKYIDLNRNISDEDIYKLWTEYSKRKSDIILGESDSTQTVHIFALFIVAIIVIKYGPESLPIITEILHDSWKIYLTGGVIGLLYEVLETMKKRTNQR